MSEPTREQTQRIWNARGGIIRAARQLIDNMEAVYDTPGRVGRMVPVLMANLQEAVKELDAAEECIEE